MTKVLLFSPQAVMLKKYLSENPGVSVTILLEVSQERRAYSSFDGLEFVSFEQFIPLDYEKIIIDEGKELSCSWFDEKFWEKVFIVKNFNIARSSEFHFLSKVILSKMTALLALENISKLEMFDWIGVPSYLVPYFRSIGFRNYRIIKSNFSLFKNSFAPSVVNNFAGSFAVMLYHIYLYVFGLFIDLRSDKNILVKTDRIFVGIIHELRHLFDNYSLGNLGEEIIFLQARKFNKYNKITKIGRLNRSRIKCLDALVNLPKLCNVAKIYWKIIWRYRHLSGLAEFEHAFVFKGFHIWELIKNDFSDFICIHAFAALKAYFVAENILESYKFNRCFFGYLNTWSYSVINDLMKMRGIITETYAHGMVQQMVLYRSAASVNYNHSAYDLQLMQRYSCDGSYLLLPSQKREIKNLEKVNQFHEVLILTKPFLDVCSSSFSEDFLLYTLDLVQKLVVRTPKIVIKIHPREDKRSYTSFLRKNNLPSCRIETSNLTDLIKNSDLIFVPFSTVIFDCIELGKPLLVCKSKIFSGITFYKELPDSFSYSTHDNMDSVLHKIQFIKNSDFNETYRNFYEKYWRNVEI